MIPIQKSVCAGLLFLIWGFFVLAGDAPPDMFIATIRDALVALGVVHVALVDPKGKP